MSADCLWNLIPVVENKKGADDDGMHSQLHKL